MSQCGHHTWPSFASAAVIWTSYSRKNTNIWFSDGCTILKSKKSHSSFLSFHTPSTNNTPARGRQHNCNAEDREEISKSVTWVKVQERNQVTCWSAPSFPGCAKGQTFLHKAPCALQKLPLMVFVHWRNRAEKEKLKNVSYYGICKSYTCCNPGNRLF